MPKDKAIKSVINVEGIEITVTSFGIKDDDYISLTDMLKANCGEFAIIKSWVVVGGYEVAVQ